MESSESHEPSYYEVALTNRQVLIAFVVLLTSIVAAFLSGVWIGRGGSSVARQPASITEAAAAAAEPPLEQLTFFNGKEPGSRTAGGPASAPAAVAPAKTDAAAAEERATEAMRENLDATMAANRTIPPPAAAAPASPPPAGTRVTTPARPAPATAATKPAAPATKPAAPAAKDPSPAKPAVTGKTFVQVYSSNNGTRAREIVAQLRKAGFAVVMAETARGGGTNYRVRVGPYSERAKADAAATKLRRDFRLETWVTDSP